MRYLIFILSCSLTAQAQYLRWERIDDVNTYGYKHLIVLDDSSVYTASYHGMYRTTNGGRFWRELLSETRPSEIYSLVPDPATSPNALVLQSYVRIAGKGTGAVYASNDGGVRWNYRGGAVGNWGGYACPTGAGSYYMLCSPDNIVHIDISGTARKFVEGLPADEQRRVRGIAPFDDDRALLYTLPGTVYAPDPGFPPIIPKSWKPANRGIEREEILHIYSEGNDAWAGTSSSGVKHTTRPQFHWTNASNGLGGQGDLSMYVRRIFRDKRGPLLAMTYAGFYTSVDGFQWNFVSNALPDWGRPDAAGVDHSGRYYVLYGPDSILVSEDEAQHWSVRMNGLVMDKVRDITLQVNEVYAAASQCVFRASVTSSPPIIWKQSIEGLTERIIACYANLPGDTLLAFGMDGSINLKHAGVPAWQQLSSVPDSGDVTCTAVSLNGTVLAGTDRGWLHRSTDRGTTWSVLRPSASQSPIVAILSVSDSLWFIGSHGDGLHRSEDGGAHWLPAGNGMSHPIITALLRRADGDLFAGSFGGGLFRSTDNGDSWFSASAALPASYITALVGNSINVIAVGSFDKGIHYSRNNGASWTELNNGLDDTRIVRLKLHTERNILLAVNQSGRLFRNAGGLPTSIRPDAASFEFRLHSAHPNPFREHIEVDLELHRPGSIRITLVDMLGRELVRMEEYVPDPGRYHRALSTASVPAGVYLLSLESEDSRQQKIVARMR